MKRINSKWTFFLKKVFPMFWLSVMMAVILAVILSKPNPEELVILLISIIIVIVVAGAVYMKFFYGAADLVFIDNDRLKVQRNGVSVSLLRSEIQNFEYKKYMNPHTVILQLTRNTALGKELKFFAPMNWMPFAANRQIMEWFEEK